MKRFLALLLALVFALVLAVPVFAAPPVHESGTFDFDNPADDLAALCLPDINVRIRDHEFGTYQVTYYFDNQGNITRAQAHIEGYDNFYNEDDPSIVLSGHFILNTNYDLDTWEFVNARGVPYHITAPGRGTVLVRAGKWTKPYPDGQIAGKNSTVDPKDVKEFCSLIAGR
ncbi:MAG TPA: hypothetical protein VFT99_11260 [Roseiflexaceae bacterium]|nr:hypothetical protein [Roseiflexaceae bacterium]